MAAKNKTDWFWSDWSGDQEVRRLDPDERGVWIDLLALAAGGKPTGYVCDAKGRPVPLEEIARFTNCPDLRRLADLIDGIVEKGAASRDRAGRLFNRRMVREAELSAKRSKASLARWGPKPNPRHPKPDLDMQNSMQNLERKGSSSPDLPLEFEEVKNGSAEPRARDDWPSDFRERFWVKYPHKVGKADAIAKLERARRKVSWADLTAGLERYVAKTDDRPWCNPATWLHQERWSDQPSLFNGGANGTHRQSSNRPGGASQGSFAALALARNRSAGGNG